MATIYDMATGAIIAGDEQGTAPATPARGYEPDATLQTALHETAIEDMNPVDAYMVMLKDLLKQL